MPSGTDFNAICYLARYPDLKDGYMFLSASGNWQYGKPTNRQLKKLSDNLFWHWQNFGMAEGRVSGCDLPGTIYSANFNASAYLARYPDIRLGINTLTGKPTGFNVNPQLHYQTIGIYEGRHPGFEIVTSNSPTGMVSPGTTTAIEDNPQTNVTSGDNTVLQPIASTSPSGTTTTPTIDPITGLTIDPATGLPVVTTPAPATSTNTWLIVGGIAALLLLTHKHKR